MKEEAEKRLKSKESSVSFFSPRQEWHHSRQQQQQGQWRATLPNYSWDASANAKELSVSDSLGSQRVFKAVPFMSYSPKLTPSKKTFPSQWCTPGLRKESAAARIRLSKDLFSNLVGKFAVCHKQSSVGEQDNFVRHLSSHKASVTTRRAGGRRASHNEEENKLCLKLLWTQSGFRGKCENKALPQKRRFIQTGCCHKKAPVVLESPILQKSFKCLILKDLSLSVWTW